MRATTGAGQASTAHLAQAGSVAALTYSGGIGGTERFAVPAEDDCPRVADIGKRLGQLGNELGVKRVAALGPRQRDAQHRPVSLHA